MAQQPPPKKKKGAPVDTTRLKRDIARDTAEARRKSDLSAITYAKGDRREADRHRGEGIAAAKSAAARSDSLNKARRESQAPVDTVRLKKDLARDTAEREALITNRNDAGRRAREHDATARLFSSADPYASTYRKFARQERADSTATEKPIAELSSGIAARQDTLRKARAGKLPVKKAEPSAIRRAMTAGRKP